MTTYCMSVSKTGLNTKVSVYILILHGLYRMDHSVSQLFEENKDHVRTIEGVETRMDNFMELAPKVTALQQEINNIISDLPRGE